MPSVTGERFESRDPHDGGLLATVAAGGTADAEAAITAARKAFDDGPWPWMTVAERRQLMGALAELVERHATELALLDTRDMGKPIRESLEMDVPRVARNLRFFAEYAELAGSEAYPE